MKHRLIWTVIPLVAGISSTIFAQDYQTSGIDSIPQQEQCQATYSTIDKTLNVPCVAVNLSDENFSYAIKLKQTDNIEGMSFDLSEASLTDSAIINECTAFYSANTGRLDIPCAVVAENPFEQQNISLFTEDGFQPQLFNLSQENTFLSRRALVPRIKEKVVLVDGISFDRTYQCKRVKTNGAPPNNKADYDGTTYGECSDKQNYNRDSYLYSQLAPALAAKGVSYLDIHAFKWSGDMIAHGENLKQKFESWFYSEVCKKTEQCNVSFIAHSWGTIIATDFVASMPEPKDTKIKIRTFVTFGSPATGARTPTLSSSEPFWWIATRKVRHVENKIGDKPGFFINITNKDDPIAWDYEYSDSFVNNNGQWFPGMLANYLPDGMGSSTKGRLGKKRELIPLANSELNVKYLYIDLVVPKSASLSVKELNRAGFASLGIDLFKDTTTLDKVQKAHSLDTAPVKGDYKSGTIVNWVTSRMPMNVSEIQISPKYEISEFLILTTLAQTTRTVKVLGMNLPLETAIYINDAVCSDAKTGGTTVQRIFECTMASSVKEGLKNAGVKNKKGGDEYYTTKVNVKKIK